jgi:imidazoleglycerol-phosphate dehydratase
MDEALAVVAVDCGGRSYLVFKSPFAVLIEGQIPGGIISHFFESLCSNAGITANMKAEGSCDHHKCEALFKAFGRALADALTEGQGGIPSTKGVL